MANWNNIVEDAKTRANDADSTTMNVFDAWFRPGVVQQYEFGQQVALQEMQNDWNSEVAKMERMKEAGINLNTAASGIAGAGASPSTGSVPSAMSAGASQAGSALGSIGSAAASMLGSAGETFDKIATLHPRRKQLLTQAKLNFANTGFTDLQSMGLVIALKYADQKEYQSVLNLQSQFETMKMERKVMDAQISELHAKVDELKQLCIKYEHENNLADMKAAEAEQNALYLQELKIMQEFRNNINKMASVDTTLPLPNMAAQLFFQGKDEMLEKFLAHVYNFNYQVNAGAYDAEADAAFYTAWNEAAGKAEVEADYAPYMASLSMFKDAMHEIYKAAFENPDSLQGLISKAFNAFFTAYGQITTQMKLDPNSPVNKYNSKRPRNPKPYRRQRGFKGMD